jgi:hypothetical protein
MSKAQPSKPIKIPYRIYEACEAEAVKRRKKDGGLIYWTTVLFEAAEKGLGLKN